MSDVATAMRPLEDLKDKLDELGFIKLKMAKQWKRRAHREVLIEGFLRVDAKTKRADVETLVLSLLDPIKETHSLHYRDEQYVHLPYSQCRGDAYVKLELMADVALPAW